MAKHNLRGTAVIDAGATNTKMVLFSPEGEIIGERRVATRHVEGPPYRHIDHEVLAELCRSALPELDRILPIDAIVPSAHGAALACLGEDGALALPVMDYTAEPPPEIIAAYRRIEPPFSEVFGPLLPMALTHAMQLYWQQQAFPALFARVRTIIPWIQYVGYRLGGRAVIEIASMSCQSQLMDVPHNRLSSLVHAQGWAPLFPPMVKAWDVTGTLSAEFRGDAFRGEGRILGGVHDSSGNYVRYLAAGLGAFTLLSSGTWIIGFDTTTGIDRLVEGARHQHQYRYFRAAGGVLPVLRRAGVGDRLGRCTGRGRQSCRGRTAGGAGKHGASLLHRFRRANAGHRRQGPCQRTEARERGREGIPRRTLLRADVRPTACRRLLAEPDHRRWTLRAE